MPDWFYAKDSQKIGPLPESEIRALIEKGTLSKDTLVWTDGMNDWLPTIDVPLLTSSDVETAICAVGGERMPISAMLNYGDQWVDPANKEVFVQGLHEGVHQPPASGAYIYADPTKRANITKRLFVIGVIFEIGMNIFDYFDSGVDSIDFTIADGFSAFFGLGFALVYTAGVVAFCMWMNRVCRNAHALATREMTITPGWSVGYFFIPIVSLWKPFQAMKEIWKASVGVAPAPVLGLWWTLWLVSGFIDQISFRLFLRDAEDTAIILDSITATLSIPLVFAIVKIIREITVAQTDQEESNRTTNRLLH